MLYPCNDDLISLFREDVKNIEIEIKFGKTEYNKFNNGTEYSTFNKVKEHFISLYQYDEEITNVSIDNNIRKITSLQSNSSIFQQKTLLKRYDFDYDIKLTISQELEIDEKDIEIFEPKFERKRNRVIIYIHELLELHLTKVINSNNNIQYEIELEYKGNENSLNIFNEKLLEIYKVYKDTKLAYSNSLKNNIIQKIRAITNSTKPGIDKDMLVETRNIKKKDFTIGGLVENKKTKYLVTYKADGFRKLLFIDLTGIWIIYPHDQFNFVVKNNHTTSFYEKFNGTILDGELVKNKNILYYYLGFDCISLNGNIKIQEKSYFERTKIIYALSNLLSNKILTIQIKKSIQFKYAYELYESTKEMLNNFNNIDYNIDGLIFIPVDIKYNPKSNYLPQNKRVLHLNPDHCKWKFVQDLTIDFEVSNKNGIVKLFAYDMNKRKLEEFRGSKSIPFTYNMLDIDHPYFINSFQKLIIEFEWNQLTNKLTPRKIREDKKTSNKLDVANQVWNDIHNPISEDFIQGKTLELVYKYHNNIKYLLYDKIAMNSTLLDIGSGRGGDINKWINQKFTKIVGVEPNKDHIDELTKRLTNLNNIPFQLHVVNTVGEDTAYISENVEHFIGGKVDVVSLMLSLSFFFDNQDRLESLVQTIQQNIKLGGYVLFLSINGESVRNLFKNADTNRLTINEAILELNGNVLYITLPGTIVETQTEYLVDFDILNPLMNKYGFELIEFEKADKDRILSETSKLFSSLYSYGYYILKERVKVTINKTITSSNVEFVDENNKIIDTKAENDDELTPMNINGCIEAYRMATINDGFSFFHCIMKITNEDYRNNNSALERINIVQQFKKYLSKSMNSIYNDKYYLSLFSYFHFNSDENPYDPIILKKKLINNDIIENKFYHFIALIIDLNIIVMGFDQEKIYILDTYLTYSNNDDYIILIYKTNYEVFQCDDEIIFNRNSPIIRNIFEENEMKKNIKDFNFTSILNSINYKHPLYKYLKKNKK